ncbi:Dihydrolipoyllysine-residue, partial [Hortaea werneckii]
MSAAAVLARASRGVARNGALSGFRAQQTYSQRIPALSALARYYASGKFPDHSIISMPALSPTMTSGNIGAWQKKPGDTLTAGEVLVEIETDKAQMDFEFQDEGVLAKILRDSGEKDVGIGNPIAVMVEDAADVEKFADFTIEDAGGDKGKPAEDKKGGQEAAESSEPPASGSGTAPPAAEESKPAAQETESSGEKLQTVLDRESVSPAAKKLALEKGVAISKVKGTGPNGAVSVKDVEKAASSGGAAGGAGAAVPAAAGAPAAATYEDIPASSMRKTIASRLQQSMNQNPHYFVASTISVGKLMKLRQALNAQADGKYKLSVNDFLIKAVACAARKVPAANSSWREDGGNVMIRQHNAV